MSKKPTLFNAAVRIKAAYQDADLDDDGEHETATITVRRSDITTIVDSIIKREIKKADKS